MKSRQLFNKLEATLEHLERTDDPIATVSAILALLVEDFKDDLGLVGGRLYVREEDDYVLQLEYPDRGNPLGFRIPVSYAPVQELLRNGFVFVAVDNVERSQEIEGTLGVDSFAAIRIGESRRHVIAFSLADDSDVDQVIFTLNTIRHVINLKLRKTHLENRVSEMRAIQGSLIPDQPPEFEGYDLWGDNQSAEEVGGDLYDFISISERSLGVAIADSAGHGLPAALQARDAIIGMRMGVEERLRITATLEKLNRVISRSALASRFISMFYCEIEPNGNLVYVNAGHNPPLLFRMGQTFELSRGGTVLGPNPHALYERGYMQMTPGSILLLYTDGITEASDAHGEMFGVSRLQAIVNSRAWTSARELVQRIFEEVQTFSQTDPPRDDQTVVAVIRLP